MEKNNSSQLNDSTNEKNKPKLEASNPKPTVKQVKFVDQVFEQQNNQKK